MLSVPSSTAQPISARSDPGRLRQIKLHEMALAYGQILRDRATRIAAELGGGLPRVAPAARGNAAVAGLACFILGTLREIIAEQYGDSASPFARAVCSVLETGPGALDDAGLPDPGSSPALEHIAGEGLKRLMPLIDLRAAEAACWDLLTGVFGWDGRRLVITADRIADAMAVVERARAALRSGTVPPDGREAQQSAAKLILTVCYFRGKTDTGEASRLKELYVSSGSRQTAATGGVDRRELAEEIEVFCRTLDVLRESAEKATKGAEHEGGFAGPPEVPTPAFCRDNKG